MSTEKPTGERRQVDRNPSPHHAFVRTSDGKLMTCVVENLTSVGALLKFESSPPPDDELQLITNTEQGTKACRVMHRSPQHLGVQFPAIARDHPD